MTWAVRFEQVGAISFNYVIRDEGGRYLAATDGSIAMWFRRKEAQAVCDKLNRRAAGESELSV